MRYVSFQVIAKISIAIMGPFVYNVFVRVLFGDPLICIQTEGSFAFPKGE